MIDYESKTKTEDYVKQLIDSWPEGTRAIAFRQHSGAISLCSVSGGQVSLAEAEHSGESDWLVDE